MTKHLTPNELAERLGLHYGTLANWRLKKYGPRFLKVGTKVRYPLSEVERWEKAELKKSLR